jgi:carboxyl-terminal processing protease
LIVVGSLAAALTLTAFGDGEAQARRGEAMRLGHLDPQLDTAELRVLDWTLYNVSRFYVEPGRIDPKRMTLAGLDALEAVVPEVLVETLGRGERVRVRVGTHEREFAVGDVELWAVQPHLREVFVFVNEHASLDLEAQREAEYAMVEGILATLDPHTNLLRPDDFEDMKTSTKGSFGGLGIEVGYRDSSITVIRVLDGNPAAKVGIKAGDRIVQIDEQSTVTMDINEAVTLLRGAPGTTVRIHVQREGATAPLPFAITRATIQLDSVVGDVITERGPDGAVHKVGLVQIPRNFAATTGRELQDKLREFGDAGVEGVILDLRDNPGGLLNAAVEVADAFLASGVIVATVGQGMNAREENRASPRDDFAPVPLVVLVDQGSASASEIVAGALRNLGRAVLIGRRTFGKGSVQVLHERRSGDKELALKLTIAQYLTPGDVSIQSVGVSPDLETVPVWVSKDHVAYYARDRFDLIREESLDAHLSSDKAKAAESAFGPLYYLQRGSLGTDMEAGEAAGAGSAKPNPAGDASADARSRELLADPEVRIARDLLLQAPGAGRDELLAGLANFVAGQTAAQEQRIAASLAKRGVDWAAGPPPAGGTQARLRVSLRSDRKGNVIRGGETGTFTATVTNEGDAPAFQVRAITDSDERYFDERELFFGRIDPGQSREYVIKLAVGEHELSRTDRVDLHLFDQHGSKLAAGSATSFDVVSEGLPRPSFAMAYRLIDDPKADKRVVGNGDGTLQVGERVLLRVAVENVGEGPSLDTWVNLRNSAGDAVFLHEGRSKLDQLAVGAARTLDLDLEVKRAPDDGTVKLQLAVTDNKIAEALVETITFPVAVAGEVGAAPSEGATARDAAQLRQSAGGDARVIGKVAAGTKFAVTGAVGADLRVRLADGSLAFVSREAVDLQPKAPPKSAAKFEPVYAVSPPRIELVGTVSQTDQARVHLSGVAKDTEAVRDVFITVYNPSRNLLGSREKVFYQATLDPRTGVLEFAADVELTPGNNIIEIHARENADVMGVRRMWVLRTSGLDEARAAAANLKSGGKLKVDRLR